MSESMPAAPPPGRRVLVVGAGPAGLLAGIELARRGVIARVVDAATGPRVDSGAVEISPQSQQLFGSSGLLDRIRARALPRRGIEVVAGGVVRRRINRSARPVLHLGQPETEAALATRIADLGVVVERGTTLTRLSPQPGGVDVELRCADGDVRARFDWVIGADGAGSAVRGLVGSGLRGSVPATYLLIGDATIDSDHPQDVTRLIVGADGVTAVKPLPDGLTRLMFQIPDPGPGVGPPDPEALCRMAFDRAEIRASDPRWSTFHVVRHGQVPRYRLGRVLLVGDAAHVQHPALGLGLGSGLRDAANLAGKLALVVHGRVGEQLLDSYHDERHPVGAEAVRRGALLTGRGRAAAGSG